MKKAIFAALVVALGFAGHASAAEIGSSALGSMGLGGMKTLSDAEGNTVRGKGTSASVWGGSAASFRGQSSANNYSASAGWAHKPARATGGSLSFAGKMQVNYAADPTGSSLSVQAIGGFAGGGASAKAW
jgi:hypothetical protein